MTINYDLVIVGAGAAGCVVAARIAQYGKHPGNGSPLKIAMIEAGPYFGQGKNMPGYGHPARRKINTFLNYEMGSQYQWPYGMVKAVGGSTMHWGTYAVIKDIFYEDDFLSWQETTGVDWNNKIFKDAVNETQTMWNLKPAPEEVLTRGNKLFIEASRSLNLDINRLAVARKNCLYCGRCGSGHFCKYDAKSTSQMYIDLALEHGVKIIPEAEVKKLVIDTEGTRPKITGVEINQNGNSNEIISASKYIVSCGITGTPMLLFRSGYGPEDKVTTPLLVKNDNIGKNFESDIMGASITAIWDEPIKSADGTSAGASFVKKDWGNNGEGRLILQDYAMGATTYPHQAALSSFAPAFGHEHNQFMQDAVTRMGGIYPFIGKPGVFGEISSNGQVTYSQNQARALEIVKWANEVTEISVNILKEMGAKEIDARPIKNVSNYSLAHTAGTCRAGVDPEISVVNPYFESHDIENLFICDASAVPRQQQYGAMPTVAVASYAWRQIVSRHFS